MNGQINIFEGNILGIDESGKGDFFGPLVISGVLVNNKMLDRLKEHNIRDSKKISDGRILELSRWLKENFIWSTVVINPLKYNELYDKIRNLNKLLGWGHSRVIENIAAENKIDAAISDKFGRDDFIEKALMSEGRKIQLKQMVRGEATPQVAAASILARAEFVSRLKHMAAKYKIDLPKGAGQPVDIAARRLMADKGRDFFAQVAKLHFKNYKKL